MYMGGYGGQSSEGFSHVDTGKLIYFYCSDDVSFPHPMALQDNLTCYGLQHGGLAENPYRQRERERADSARGEKRGEEHAPVCEEHCGGIPELKPKRRQKPRKQRPAVPLAG